jgi:hypothetical protein
LIKENTIAKKDMKTRFRQTDEITNRRIILTDSIIQFPEINEQMDLIRRGAVEIIPEEELIKKLEKSKESGKPLKYKIRM